MMAWPDAEEQVWWLNWHTDLRTPKEEVPSWADGSCLSVHTWPKDMQKHRHKLLHNLMDFADAVRGAFFEYMGAITNTKGQLVQDAPRLKMEVRLFHFFGAGLLARNSCTSIQ